MNTQTLYSLKILVISPQMQESFSLVLSKKTYPVFVRIHGEAAQRKPVESKKSSRGKLSQRNWAFSKENTLEAEKKHSVHEKDLQLPKVITPPVICQLS